MIPFQNFSRNMYIINKKARYMLGSNRFKMWEALSPLRGARRACGLGRLGIWQSTGLSFNTLGFASLPKGRAYMCLPHWGRWQRSWRRGLLGFTIININLIHRKRSPCLACGLGHLGVWQSTGLSFNTLGFATLPKGEGRGEVPRFRYDTTFAQQIFHNKPALLFHVYDLS